MVVELEMYYCGKKCKGPFETYETFLLCVIIANFIFEILIDWLFLRDDFENGFFKIIQQQRRKNSTVN